MDLLNMIPSYRAILAARITINYCKTSYPEMGIYPFSNNYRHLLFIPVYNGIIDYSKISMPNGVFPRRIIPELYTELFIYLTNNTNIARDWDILGRFNMVERYIMHATTDLQLQIAQAIRNIDNDSVNNSSA